MNLWEKTRVLYRAWRYRLRTERPEIRFMLKHLRAGQLALDIGSYKGVHAYWMHRKVVPGGRVIAFEPQRDLAAYVERVKSAFRLDRLTIVNAALSSTAGTKEMFRPVVNPWGEATLEKVPCEGETILVPTIVLDDHLDAAGARPVHFIKCDVEGHELEVFQGGERMLSEDHPILLFECQDYRHCEGQTRRVFQYLEKLGYDGYFFEDGKPTPVSRFRPEVHQVPDRKPPLHNFAFLPQT